MKYTVLIRQPVSEEVRPQLEEQLVQRFGLTPEQAQRLAGRRSGRLMKPTSQARAELLREVFESVGGQVTLEEVRSETGVMPTAPADAPAAPAPTVSATLPSDPFAAPHDPFAAPTNDPFAAPADDPFAPSVMVVTPVLDSMPALTPDDDPELAAQLSTPLRETDDSSEGLPNWARAVNSKADAPASAPAVAAPQDDWADFTGSLSMPEPEAALPAERPLSDAPRQSTEFLTEISEEAAVTGQPRNSVAQQIRLGTLFPLGLAGLLTLLLLAFSLPRLQNQLVQQNAQTLASVVGTSLDAGAAALNEQLGTIARNPNVGFVRAELPNGTVYTRSAATTDINALNSQLAQWAQAGQPSGNLKVSNQSYSVSRVSIIHDPKGQLVAVPVGQENKAQVVRRVMVGISNGQAVTNMRSTLLLVLLMTILGLIMALYFAARASRQIVGPLERLVEVADAISLGDLSRPVKMERNDEIGDLAQALERMRLSLEAAMDRLRRRKRM